MIKSTAIALLLSSLSYNVMADWAIDNAQSSVSFVTLKKANVMEAHHFESLTGKLADSGEFTLSIDLASVDTAISIRDQRMQQYLFETTMFPMATLSAKILPRTLAGIKKGESKKIAVDAALALHGQMQNMTINVSVTRLANNSLLVTSLKPVLINASDFDLVKGIEKLRQLAGLPSISHTVPVSFILRLNK